MNRHEADYLYHVKSIMTLLQGGLASLCCLSPGWSVDSTGFIHLFRYRIEFQNRATETAVNMQHSDICLSSTLMGCLRVIWNI